MGRLVGVYSYSDTMRIHECAAGESTEMMRCYHVYMELGECKIVEEVDEERYMIQMSTALKQNAHLLIRMNVSGTMENIMIVFMHDTEEVPDLSK